MPLAGFSGPAGSGKTHALVNAVRTRIASPATASHHRLLALTFMHGSRRRLDERFSSISETRGKSTCATVDSFAYNLLRRFPELTGAIPPITEFDAICDACGALVERPEIARWVASTFPIVAVDEAQELKPCRLRIVQALSEHTDLFAAADEFQCLDSDVDTAPFMQWFETGTLQPLTVNRRTNQAGLLSAAAAIRQGQAPVRQGVGLKIKYEFPAQMPFAIGHSLNSATGSTAVLVAPGATHWANELIPRLTQGFRTNNQQINPVRISWETNGTDEVAQILESVCTEEQVATSLLASRIANLTAPPIWINSVLRGIDHARRAQGRLVWTRNAFREFLERKCSAHRAFGYAAFNGAAVMSIHAAKNRQFRNVIVLWGPGVVGTDDYKRRLLYNAITRAEFRCHIYVRTRQLLTSAPFA